MKYFCTTSEQKGTCYHEWQRGRWDEKTHWKEDSLLLHDDILVELNIGEFLAKMIPSYTDYGEFEVDVCQWERIYNEVNLIGGEIKEVIEEADEWVRDNFVVNEVFTILGI